MAAVAVAFDTLKAATRLQEAGFDETKARVLVSTFAEGMVENLATKEELAALRGEVATKAELANLATKPELGNLATKDDIANLTTKADLASLATKEEISALATKVELEALRGEMKEMGANLRAEINKVQERMTVRLGGAIAAAVAVLVAVDKLL